MADSMEKGFNDSELEDIMSEIESLEKEYVEDSDSSQGNSESEIIEAASNEVHEEKSVSQQEEIEEAQVLEETVVAINQPSVGKPCQSRMDFSISGDMQMQLNFTVAGQVVKLHVDEESGFKIEMEGGATFSLPLGDHKKVG